MKYEIKNQKIASDTTYFVMNTETNQVQSVWFDYQSAKDTTNRLNSLESHRTDNVRRGIQLPLRHRD